MKQLSKLLIIFFITSCIAPSAEMIQIANANTQIALPTSTNSPTLASTAKFIIPEEYQGKLSLFILAGQSNMSGRGDLTKLTQKTNSKIFLFGNDYHWKVAVEPVDDSINQVDKVSEDKDAGFSPSLSFATSLLERNSGMIIGLIPCASMSTSIYDWQRHLSDNTLYGSCLKRALAASTMGKVAGILFFQGETDAIDPSMSPDQVLLPKEWASRFIDFVNSLRGDLGLPELPVIFAQIGMNVRPNMFPNWSVVMQQQESVKLPFCAMIKTDDLLLTPIHLKVLAQS